MSKPERRRGRGGLAVDLAILIISLVMLFPLFWIFITAMKSQAEILKEPMKLIPSVNMLLANLREVWARADWLTYYRNTIVLTVSVWAVQMAVALPAGYAFAVLDFPGKDLLFLLVLTRLMVSPESTMLSNYMTVLGLGAYDSMVGVMLPYVVSAQAIFIFRQAFKQLPPALRESARIDGCSELGYLFRVAVPLIRPYILSFSIVTCVFQWNAFFWPMLVTKSPRILSVAMTYFGLQAESGSEWGLTMAAALIVTMPLLVLFVIFQKKFTNSFVRSGLK